MSKEPGLDSAYALDGPDATRRLYANWARTYESEFIAQNDYLLHLHVAEAHRDAGGMGPALDVGAGTGILGAALREMGCMPLDALDLSAEMLSEAEAKGIYRGLYAADVLDPQSLPGGPYDSIVSAGTFTNGHVGPGAIDNLLAIARRGAIFCLSINAEFYARAGFEAAFEALGPAISAPDLRDRPIYGPKASGPHAHDRALIATFRKL